MRKRPACSVALATCNGEPWIARQLGSILDQLGPDDEVVVADASSSDGTLSIIESFSDDRVRILRDLPRGDIPGTFERALRECRGDFVFLSDQDDVWLPGKVERCVQALSDAPEELLLHDARIVDADGIEIAPSFLDRIGFRAGVFANLWKPAYLGCALCAQRSLLDRALPFPRKVPMHDWWLGLLAEKGDGVLVLREALILHRRHGRNASYGPGESRYGLFKRLWMRASIWVSVQGRHRASRRRQYESRSRETEGNREG